MPLGDIAAGILEVIGRFLIQILYGFVYEILFEFLIRVPGEFIVKHLVPGPKDDVEPNSALVIFAGFLFWVTLAGVVFIFVNNG